MYKKFLLEHYRKYPVPETLSTIGSEFDQLILELRSDKPVLAVNQDKYENSDNSIGDSILHSNERLELSFEFTERLDSTQLKEDKALTDLERLPLGLGAEIEMKILFLVQEDKLSGPFSVKEIRDKYKNKIINLNSRFRLVDLFVRESGNIFSLSEAIKPRFLGEITVSPFVEKISRKDADLSVIQPNHCETGFFEEFEVYNKLNVLKAERTEEFSLTPRLRLGCLRQVVTESSDEWEEVKVCRSGRHVKSKGSTGSSRLQFSNRSTRREENLFDLIIRKKEEQKQIKPNTKKIVIKRKIRRNEDFVDALPRRKNN